MAAILSNLDSFKKIHHSCVPSQDALESGYIPTSASRVIYDISFQIIKYKSQLCSHCIISKLYSLLAILRFLIFHLKFVTMTVIIILMIMLISNTKITLAYIRKYIDYMMMKGCNFFEIQQLSLFIKQSS